MATFFSNTQTYLWSGSPVMGTLTGNVSRSGNTVTLSNMSLSLTVPAGGAWGSDTLGFTVNGTGTNFAVTGSDTSLGTHSLNNTSFSVSGSQTSATVGWSSSDGYSGSFTVSFSSGAPSGLAISGITPATDSITATVSVTAWNGGSSSTRYRGLSVCPGQDATRRKYVLQYGDSLSGSITVDNSTAYTQGTAFTITPNTRYYLTMYATNGTDGTGNTNFTAVATLAEIPTVTLTSKTSDSASFAYTVPADGGFYNKILEYSLDGGSTWNTIATITSGSASTGTFTITGLTSGDHTVFVRSRTTSGSAGNAVISWSSVGVRLIASDGTTGKEGTRLLVSVDGTATEATRILVSHNGVATENA